ncbi:MAG: hypothetical protein EPO10_14695 [Reyranella sp.]|uniref:hypothetical protein n=1 Tax=Reyranella sp. TaxID=1929291 RepID=UPI0011FF559C|nr:hypothetical protein [Reyranella sp.]TAJ97352.1 MAG: hypothetical protein EPO41_02800 [Reyranella sp.]TBR28107.1 MAG: hypothetical protein EPO10_14695 [Reyranella sp.]
MAMFILLTAGQADHVRGPSTRVPSAALEPVEHQGGVFILGVDVLADPAHEAHWAYLAALPQMDSGDPEFPQTIEP